MKIVYCKNTISYFELPSEYMEKNREKFYTEEFRTDPELIKILESEKYCGDWHVAKLPDEITDYIIVIINDEFGDEYECIYYVTDGKIHFYEEK